MTNRNIVTKAFALLVTGVFGYAVLTVWREHPGDFAVRVLAAVYSGFFGYVLRRVGVWRYLPRFSVAEYAVIVAIIGVLAAILYPVTTHCGDSVRAKRYMTLSNLKQSGLAMLQYTQDYDEKLPPRLEVGLVRESLAPYLQSDRLLHEAETGRAFTWRGDLRGVRLDRVRNAQSVVIAHAPFADTTAKRPRRAVLFLDGHARELPEAEFAAALAVKPQYAQIWRCATP
ncbi:MAG: hypothetical protein H7Y38_09700 [Armatimonadetes bacterium]|nr:hypothetical protein [Armatimonadota bacterium]